ncbi:RraA family protein [Paenibacillus sp. MWE-103]|uniref:Putative 4-hydroxy-4-methyl-2-oxoglutarate aldolase n=1 Tax=Paenibacillus artemisiicola TaxID=1172618 RepID=A0ABS3W5V2_9BACL|nr:RraA family protein [Paenibacillus artemisiicola]MBO7743691.1 RraA family protein [Paenibacillus artemisiicola]
MQDAQLFELMRNNLYTGVICDTLDALGYRNQAMAENIRPLRTGDILVGRAKTIHAVDTFYAHDNCYDKEIEAIDSIRPGEVVVGATNQSKRNGLWGELLSTASKMRGANGAVIDGLVRDTRKILELAFPVFSTGFKPVDSKGRGMVIDYDCPVDAGGVIVKPGDVIFADIDGVAVIPKEVFETTVEQALGKVESENNTRRELLEGKLLREVYDKYGVL